MAYMGTREVTKATILSNKTSAKSGTVCYHCHTIRPQLEETLLESVQLMK
jgi:hypothetical protein